jgi:hypothetical protein
MIGAARPLRPRKRMTRSDDEQGADMRRLLGVVTVMLAMVTVAAAQEVRIDHDAGADFSNFETFDWAPTPETSLERIDPLLHSQVKNAIEYYLSEGGLVQTEGMPDLLVTYHTGVAGLVRLDAASYGYDYGPEWRWDPAWGPDAGDYAQKVRTYPRGTLIIDIWDLRAERVVWRGTVVGIVAEDPSAARDEVHEALQAMIARWREMNAVPPGGHE